MSLRERILMVLLLMFCCYAGLEFIVLRQVIVPELIKQEQEQAKTTMSRCTDALGSQLSYLHQQLSQQAQSGQFYPLIQSASDDLLGSVMRTYELDFLFMYDSAWNLKASRTGTPDQSGMTEFFCEGEQSFIKKNISGYSSKAMILYQNQLFFVTAVPFTRSSSNRVIEGTVVAGRALTHKHLGMLRQQLQLNFNWAFLIPNQQGQVSDEVVCRVTPEQPYDFVLLSKKVFQGSTVLYDFRKQPVLLIRLLQDRTVHQQSLQNLFITLYVKLGIGVVTVLFLTGLLQFVVINPILKLVRHIVSVGHRGTGREVLALSRKDEIGILAGEFNQMCQRLQNAQVKLVEKSYLSGVTEMSSGLLHNVRNAISPIITRIERIKEQFKNIPVENLQQAQAELRGVDLDSQRHQDMLRFVSLTFQDILVNFKNTKGELDVLSEQVAQIEDMLNLQRTFGRTDRPVQFILPQELLDKAIGVVPEEHLNKCHISIDQNIKKLPAIPVEPTTFTQVLQNLLINSAESLENKNPLYRKIQISASIENHEKREMLHWQIQDNGLGIPAEKIQQIFERGVSSKRKGLTGIGLHWCANTITAMRGRIWAESQGKHYGATFHVLIPMTPDEELEETVSERRASNGS